MAPRTTSPVPSGTGKTSTTATQHRTMARMALSTRMMQGHMETGQLAFPTPWMTFGDPIPNQERNKSTLGKHQTKAPYNLL